MDFHSTVLPDVWEVVEYLEKVEQRRKMAATSYFLMPKNVTSDPLHLCLP